MRQDLSVRRGQARQIDACPARPRSPIRRRQQPDAQHGVGEGRAFLLTAQGLVQGMQQRFEVDQDRVLAHRDQVLVVHVDGRQGIEEGEVAALAQVEALDPLGARARSRRHAFDPAVLSGIEHLQAVEGRGEPAGAGPLQEILERRIDLQRPRLVDEPEPGIERKESHRPAAAVGVALAGADLREETQGAAGREDLAQLLRVGGQMAEDLQAVVHPAGDGFDNLACKHGILAQQPEGDRGVAQGIDEALEPLFRCRTGQLPGMARQVELQHHGAREEVQKRPRQIARQQGAGGRRIERWRGKAFRQLAKAHGQVGVGRIEERTDHREEAGLAAAFEKLGRERKEAAGRVVQARSSWTSHGGHAVTRPAMASWGSPRRWRRSSSPIPSCARRRAKKPSWLKGFCACHRARRRAARPASSGGCEPRLAARQSAARSLRVSALDQPEREK